MFVYKKLFSFPSIFREADNGSGGNADGGGSSNPGAGENGSEEGKSKDSNQGNEGQENKEDGKEEKTVPYSRFFELNKKTKDLQTQLDSILEEKKKTDKAKEKQERESKEKAGEFENLYNETQKKYDILETEATSKTERITALETVIQELLDNELKDIDEEHLDLIPSNLNIEERLSWISKAKSRGLFGTKTEEINIGGPNNPQQPKKKMEEMSPTDLFRMAFSKK